TEGLGKDLDHAPLPCETVVSGKDVRLEHSVRDFEHGIETGGRRLVATEQAERSRVASDDVAQERAEHARRFVQGCAGLVYRDGVVPIVGQGEGTGISSRVRMWIGAHSAMLLGCELEQIV